MQRKVNDNIAELHICKVGNNINELHVFKV